jgi:hypothetical protein
MPSREKNQYAIHQRIEAKQWKSGDAASFERALVRIDSERQALFMRWLR